MDSGESNRWRSWARWPGWARWIALFAFIMILLLLLPGIYAGGRDFGSTIADLFAG